MKTLNLLVILFLFIYGSGSVAGQRQSIPDYPIPSTNIVVYGLADFANQPSILPKVIEEKRQVHIHLTSVEQDQPDCQAMVWVYSLDGLTVLGPFTAVCGLTLDVDIDNRDWGVLVDSDIKVIVDVWFTEE
jgi:hypothetical protein